MPEVAKLPDEFFAVESHVSYSYRFVDKDGLPMPNEFGFRVIKYLKTSCVQNGRAVIPHSDVNPILVEYSRDELASLLVQHGDPWIPFVPKKGVKKPDEE
ncbi:MAG: hypothetical protein COY46_02265 [Chloroflexi bacterium CG_4_10_14_0_8_um_filter_46_9]|nr:MAG: hypothetical protein COY46_02265 [Chloroflexi bacterium CG_4_10_14_0_8_um_filter_46_9]